MKATIAAALNWIGQLPAIENELIARDQPLLLWTTGRWWVSRVPQVPQRKSMTSRAAATCKVAWLSIGTQAIPIEQSKRRVARLLDLGHNQSGSQSVDGPSRNEHAVPHDRLKAVQAVGGVACRRDCVPRSSGRHPGATRHKFGCAVPREQ